MDLIVNGQEPHTRRNAVVLAGLAGGMAEILWVALYSVWAPANGGEIARQIVASLWPSLASGAFAVSAGIVIHLVLALALGVFFAAAVWVPYARRRGGAVTLVCAVVVLASVWVVNFFVILPALNPVFVTLMPYWVTLLSKLLFGIAMASMLNGFPQAVWACGATHACTACDA